MKYFLMALMSGALALSFSACEPDNTEEIGVETEEELGIETEEEIGVETEQEAGIEDDGLYDENEEVLGDEEVLGEEEEPVLEE